MKWKTVKQETPALGTICWMSRPTRQDRTPLLVAVGSDRAGLEWIGPDFSMKIRPTDQWAVPQAPPAPRLLKQAL